MSPKTGSPDTTSFPLCSHLPSTASVLHSCSRGTGEVPASASPGVQHQHPQKPQTCITPLPGRLLCQSWRAEPRAPAVPTGLGSLSQGCVRSLCLVPTSTESLAGACCGASSQPKAELQPLSPAWTSSGCPGGFLHPAALWGAALGGSSGHQLTF